MSTTAIGAVARSTSRHYRRVTSKRPLQTALATAVPSGLTLKVQQHHHRHHQHKRHEQILAAIFGEIHTLLPGEGSAHERILKSHTLEDEYLDQALVGYTRLQ